MPLRSRARSMHQRIARTAPTTWLRSPSRSSASSVSRTTRMWGRGFMPPRYASARKPSRWTPWLSWPRSSESSKTSATCSASSRGSSSVSNAAIKQSRRSSIRTRRISSPHFSAMVTLPLSPWRDCVHSSNLFALPRTLWLPPVCLRALVNELLGDACPTVILSCSRKCREGTRRGISTESKAAVGCSRFEPASENDEVYLGAVEFSNAREVRPLFEAEAFEQSEAGLVAGEGPRGQGLYAQIRSTPDSLFQQAPAYPLSSVVLLDVNADLGGPVIGGPAVPEVAEAEPAYYLSVLFGHPDRTSRRVVLVKPGQPLFDGDGLCVGRHYAARHDGVVDLHDGREILQRGVTRSHARPSIPSQR